MQSDRDGRIRERAHQIWLDEGRVEGKESEHWHRAEREIVAEEGAAKHSMAAKGETAKSAAPKNGGKAEPPKTATAAKPPRSRAKPAHSESKPGSNRGRSRATAD